jgi:glycosyltransferase involved in cell wall biosynthesis
VPRRVSSLKKRIAVIQFYFYPDISAVSQMLQDLLIEVGADPGLEITVFAGRSAYQEDRGVEGRSRKLPGIAIRRLFTLNFGKTRFLTRILDYSFYYAGIFVYLLFGPRWDAVVCLTSPPLIGFVASLALLFRRSRLVQYIQDLYPEILFDLRMIRSPWLTRRLRFLNQVAFTRADRIVTIGRYMSRKVIRYCRSYGKKLVEVSNWAKGIGFEETRPESDEAAFVILYSGNIGMSHDFNSFGRLVSSLKRVNGIRYQFTGGGGQKEYLQRLFADLGEGRVRFTDYLKREDIGGNLAGGDLLLLAQKRETVGDILPSKLYSYLAAGRPILFLGPLDSEIGTLILQNDVGVVCESERDLAIARRYILFLMRHPEVKRSIGRRARRVYEERFTLDRSARRFRRVLESCLAG